MAVAARARQVPGRRFVAVGAHGIAAVVEGHRVPAERIVAAGALPGVVRLGGSMAKRADAAAGAEARSVPQAVHTMAGIAVIGVVIGWLIVCMAVDAVLISQVIEGVLAPILGVVAG